MKQEINEEKTEQAVRQHAVRQHAVVTHDLEPTSPTPLSGSGKPSGLLVNSEAPGHTTAPEVRVESAALPKEQGSEYKAPPSRFPERITAKEVQADRSNPDGCQSFEVQR